MAKGKFLQLFLAIPTMSSPVDKLCTSKWKQRTHDTHQQHMTMLANEGKEANILLLGSSMFERFDTSGQKYKEKFLKPRKAVLAGVGGDGIPHMLYRIEQGLIDACPESLQLLVLQAGTNNIENCTPEQLAKGVQCIVDAIHDKRPDLPVILFGLCPRDSQKKKLSNEKLMERIVEGNRLLAQTQNICSFNEVMEPFLKNQRKDDTFYDDHVHFNSLGYGRFASAIIKAIDEQITPPEQ